MQNTVLCFPWLWRRACDWMVTRFCTPRRRSGEVSLDAEVLNGVCVLFSARALRDVGLFDEKTFAYIEDVDWAYRAGRLGYRCRYLPVDGIVHRQKTTGYERGGQVDYLLKRNTLYFMLKTRHWAQAAGYSLATLALPILFRYRQRSPWDWRHIVAWQVRLARTYRQLWLGRIDRIMGRPDAY